MNITLEFGGGAELLVNKQKQHQVSLPAAEAGKAWRLQELLYWIRDNLLQERPELFLKENTVRSGYPDTELWLANNTELWLAAGAARYPRPRQRR